MFAASVNSLEDEVKSIQVEKNSINYRKQVMFSEYERERLVKAELERERTQVRQLLSPYTTPYFTSPFQMIVNITKWL